MKRTPLFPLKKQVRPFYCEGCIFVHFPLSSLTSSCLMSVLTPLPFQKSSSSLPFGRTSDIIMQHYLQAQSAFFLYIKNVPSSQSSQSCKKERVGSQSICVLANTCTCMMLWPEALQTYAIDKSLQDLIPFDAANL